MEVKDSVCLSFSGTAGGYLNSEYIYIIGLTSWFRKISWIPNIGGNPERA